jgi:cell division protein FtsW
VYKRQVIRVLLFIVVPLFFLYQTQSDLGTTLICIVGILAVMWLGGVKPYILITVVVLGVAFMVFAVFGTGYRSGRLVYLDPWNDGQGGYGTGYNIIRSYYAFAEGGLFGVGLGNSHEKYQYLFASDSDFIFAVVGEELGLVGALTVIILFLVMLVAGLRISSMCPDAMGSVIAGAFTTMLVFQAFLNIGCTIGVFPTTGKPLPFISSGGSSMIASLAMVGFILSVSKGDDPATRRGNLRAVRVGAGPRP